MSTTTVIPRQLVRLHCHPNLMVLALVLTDVLSLSAAGAVALLVHWWVQGVHGLGTYLALAPFISLFLIMFSAMGLYSGISASPSEELRKSTIACVLISLCVAVSSLSIRESHTVFTWTIGLAIGLGIVAVPLGREIVRLRCSRAPWWGYPTMILGDEQSVRPLIRTLHDRPDLGLKPVAVLCAGTVDAGHIFGVPVLEESDLAEWEPQLAGRGYALLTGAANARERWMTTITANRKSFPHVLIIPESWEFSSFWVSPKDLGGLLGLEIREHLFQPSKQALKRLMDVVLTSGILLVALPLLCLIALLIRLDSPGPVLYGQRRIGRGGSEFRAWKFRSMVGNADELLAKYLADHPELAAEWEENHKLRQDPRVTRLGRFLRQTSFDELPQLWNVLRGEMSLVGPRPIVRAEIFRYGKHYDLYTSVRSGLTGLWQVSGRSETSYADRVTFDTFYVRNWSVWLDLYILFRTIGVLCLRTGAY